MTKAENSHIHTQIQHDFSISRVNSPRRKMLSQKGLGVGRGGGQERKVK